MPQRPYLLSRTHHTTRFSSVKAGARKAGAFLKSNASFVLAGLELLYGRYQANKAASAARAAAADSATIDISVNNADTGDNIPVAIGRCVVEGKSAYLATGQRVPWTPRSKAIYSDGTALGRLDYTHGDVGHRDPVHEANNRQTFLLSQDIICRHAVSELRFAMLDDEPYVTGWNTSRFFPTATGHDAFPVVFELGTPGTASDMATRFDEGYDGVNGNSLHERDANSTFPLGAFVTSIAWNDVFGVPAYRRVPRYSYQFLGALLAGVKKSGSTYSKTDAAYSNLAPLALLWVYEASWGMDTGNAAQKTLQSVLEALPLAQKIMQGKGGLDSEAYPAIFNAIEGTTYSTYADAFADRDYVSIATLSGQRTDLTTGAGFETGWPLPDLTGRSLQSVGSRMIGPDDQAWVIRYGEANGVLFPADNRPSLLVEIMQMMPFASFARQLGSGERELRWPDLSGAVPAADYTLTGDDVLSWAITPPADPATNVRVAYAESAEDGAAETHTLFDEERAGASTHAADYFAARFGNRRNTLRITAALVDNQYAAAHIGWCAMSEVLAERVAIERNCLNGYSDVGDILELSIPDRSVSVKVLVVTAQTNLLANTQNIGGIVLTDHMAAWPVTRRRGAEEPSEQPPRGAEPAEAICAEWDDDRQLVLIDFDCGTDDSGNVVRVPAFEAGCDADRDYVIGSPPIALPVYGPGEATYTLTGLPTGVTYDADEHQLVVANSTAAGSYTINVAGAIGDHSATCAFKLTIHEAGASFAIRPVFSNVDASFEGGAWRVRMARGQRRFGLRNGAVALTDSGLPASMTFTIKSPDAADRTETVNRASDGTITGTTPWSFDEWSDFTINLEKVVTIQAVAGGETVSVNLIVTRPKG